MVEYFSKWIIATNVICTIIVIAAVVLRYVARSRSPVKLGADDLMITISMAFIIGIAIMNIYAGTTNCLDKSLPYISEMEKSHMYAYLEIILNLPVYGMSKVAIILFCKRIFITRDFTIAANILLAIIFGWNVSGLLVHIWSARPITSWWTQIIPAFVINWNAFFIYLVAFNMILDVMVWLLPVVVIRRLHMSFNRKVFLYGIFTLGLLCIVISAVRLYFAVQLYRAVNFQISFKYYLTSIVWSIVFTIIESTLALVIVCLPTYGPLFKRSEKPSSRSKAFQSLSTMQSSSTRVGEWPSLSYDVESDWPLPRPPPTTNWHWRNPSPKVSIMCTAPLIDNAAQRTQKDSIMIEKTFEYHVEDVSGLDDQHS